MHALLLRQGIAHLAQRNIILRSGALQDVPFPADRPSQRMAGNAHQVIWVLFRHWLKTDQAVDFVERTVSLRGTSLADWVIARPTQKPLRPVLASLMQGWRVDVARFSSDRTLRNRVSYNPNRLDALPTGVTPQSVAEVFRQVWLLLEPNGPNSFENIDRHIFRDTADALAKTDSKVVRNAPALHGESFNEAWVKAVLGSEFSESLVNFLDHTDQTNSPDLLTYASKDLTTASLGDQLSGMLGRSLILLRFATGAARDLVSRSGVKKPVIYFWLDQLLSTHGARPPEDPPKDYQSLFTDVGDVLDDLSVLDGAIDANDFPLIGEEIAKEICILSGFERVPAWAVA